MIKCREVYKHTGLAMCINSQVFMSGWFRSWRTVEVGGDPSDFTPKIHFKHQIIETVNITNIHPTIRKLNSSVSCEDF